MYFCKNKKRQIMEPIIKLGQGIGELTFDMPIEKIILLLGEAAEVEVIDNAFDEPTTIMSYDDYTLFFEGEAPKLTRIDISNEEAQLFDKKIFEENETNIIALMRANGYTEYDTEIEDWGERCVSFYNNIDFYFENDELISVIIDK